jgi:SAM-dependent methyltransferase
VNREEILLDIGSGYGRVLDYLGDKGFKHVIGLESDFQLLGKRHHPVVLGKGQEAPFKKKIFGAIFLIGVLSYVLEDTLRQSIFDEIRRILRPRGFLFLSCFLISPDGYHRRKYREGQNKHEKYGIFESDSGGIFRHTGEEELKKLLGNFQILEWKVRSFTTMNNRQALGALIEAQKP